MGALNLIRIFRVKKHGSIKNVSLEISFVVWAEEARKIKINLVIPHAIAFGGNQKANEQFG